MSESSNYLRSGNTSIRTKHTTVLLVRPKLGSILILDAGVYAVHSYREKVSLTCCCSLNTLQMLYCFTRRWEMSWVLLCPLPALVGALLTDVTFLDKDYWFSEADTQIKKALDAQKLNLNTAKNIVLVIGDGMSVATTTGKPIYVTKCPSVHLPVSSCLRLSSLPSLLLSVSPPLSCFLSLLLPLLLASSPSCLSPPLLCLSSLVFHLVCLCTSLPLILSYLSLLHGIHYDFCLLSIRSLYLPVPVCMQIDQTLSHQLNKWYAVPNNGESDWK